MSKVLILIGSTSDEPIMNESVRYLEWFGIEAHMHVASAHRTPKLVVDLTEAAQSEGYSVIIAAAGMAAALPGVVAAHTALPVYGVPLPGGLQGGVDALYSIVQMPAGIPVGTLAVGKAGARNAAVLAARTIALQDNAVAAKLEEFKGKGFKLSAKDFQLAV